MSSTTPPPMPEPKVDKDGQLMVDEFRKEASLKEVACKHTNVLVYLYASCMCYGCPEVGFNLVIDRTGRLMKCRKAVTRKDVLANPRVTRSSHDSLWVYTLVF